MSRRSSRSKLGVVLGLALVVCLATYGHEAKSSPRPFVTITTEMVKTFHHNYPFIIKVKRDGGSFDKTHVPTVKYKYKNSKMEDKELEWKGDIYKYSYSKSGKHFYVCVLAQHPDKLVKKGGGGGGGGTGSGTGTIVVTTSDGETTPVPVSADSDTEEYP